MLFMGSPTQSSPYIHHPDGSRTLPTLHCPRPFQRLTSALPRPQDNLGNHAAAQHNGHSVDQPDFTLDYHGDCEDLNGCPKPPSGKTPPGRCIGPRCPECIGDWCFHAKDIPTTEGTDMVSRPYSRRLTDRLLILLGRRMGTGKPTSRMRRLELR